MKAIVLVEKEKLKYMNIEQVPVTEDLVRIDVIYTGVCGSDYPRVLNGKVNSYPLILGHEFSGVVKEVGPKVENIKIGDHVVGIPLAPCFNCEDCNNGNYSLCKNYSFYGSRKNGSYAESIILPEKNVFKISKEISLKSAAFFEPITAGYHALKHANYKPNKTVAILGNGTIGLFTMQLAKALGASKIVMIGRSKSKFDLAKRLGADECLSTLDENIIEQALELTNNRGFDYIFEAAGNPQTMQLSFELIANKGTVCIIGTTNDNLIFPMKQWELLNRKEFYLTGSWMSYSLPFPGEEWEKAEELLVSKTIKVDDEMIYKIFNLEEAYKAFDDFKNNKVKGKVLLKCNTEYKE